MFTHFKRTLGGVQGEEINHIYFKTYFLSYIPERQSLGAAREEVLGRIRHIEEQGHQ